MDREKIMDQIDKLTDELAKLEPTDEKYKVVQTALKELHEMLLKEDRAIEERSYKNQQIDLEERRLVSENCMNAEKIKQSKRDSFFGVLKTLLGIGGSAILMWLLDDVKKESIVDKDLFSIARGWFPRG